MPNDRHRGGGAPRWRAILSRVVPLVFYVLLAVFLVIYIRNVDWSMLAGISVSWWPLIAATILSLGFRYWGVLIWFRLLYRLGGTGLRGHYRELTYIYAKSWLGRYIPGAATWILGKVYFAGRHGVPRSKLAVSGVLEGALQIVAALAVGLALIVFDPRTASLDPWIRWGILAALVVSVVLLLPPVFNAQLRLAFRILRRGTPEREILPGWRAMAEASGMYAAGVLITGFSYYLMAIAVYPDISLLDAPYIVGAASLASAISMLAIFAPGGLGVRESTLALLLAVVMPGSVALVLVVVLRVWSIAVDGLFYGITWLARDRRRPVPAVEPA